jgi:excisionase family DNA binding protein
VNTIQPQITGRRALSVEEARGRLGVSRAKFYQMIGAGQIVAHKLGRKTVIFNTDLDACFEALPRMGRKVA